MLIRSIMKPAACLLFGIGLVACASTANPVDKPDTPDDSQAGLPVDSTIVIEKVQPTEVAQTPSPAVSLPDLGPAPDIANEVWLNTDQPLNLAALRGKVVLVEFWTFG